MWTEEDFAKGFKEGIDCAMGVLHEVADDMGLTGEEAFRLSSCFGVGMMQGSVCGAVSAAFMAIGHRYGNSGPNQMDQKGMVISKREEFLTKFRLKFGDDVTCPGLLKLDFRKPEDAQKIRESGITFTLCPKICFEATKLIKEMI